jgi:predicted ArsR family transcriptional regulator
LDRAAAAHGRGLGSAAAASASAADPLDTVSPLLRDNGYQPRREGDQVVLANCPFHGLVRTQPELVCRMNASLLGAVADEATGGRLVAELSPAPDRCCVVLSVPDPAGGPSDAPARRPIGSG